MKVRRVVAIAVLVSVVTGVTAIGAGPATAATDSGPLDEVLDDADDATEFGIAGFEGWVDRQIYRLKTLGIPFLGDDETTDTASDELEEVQSYYNPRSAEFEAWINARSNASADYDVVGITFELDGETASKVLVAEVNSTTDDYQNSSIVDSTERSIDHNVTLCGYAADSAPAELETYYNEFVEPDEDLTSSYVGRLAGQYKGGVETSLLDSTGGEC
jgi:hypothetical protein